LGEAGAEFVTAKSNPELLQAFVNTILGQGWSTPSMVNELSLIHI